MAVRDTGLSLMGVLRPPAAGLSAVGGIIAIGFNLPTVLEKLPSLRGAGGLFNAAVEFMDIAGLGSDAILIV